MDKAIKKVKTSFQSDLKSCKTSEDLEQLRIKYLGRRGQLTDLFNQFGTLSNKEKPKYGKTLNVLKSDLTTSYNEKLTVLNLDQGNDDKRDFSLPGYALPKGNIHPLEHVTDEIKSIFQSIGFSVAYGPEIDDDYHNFEALNVPKHHPARDMQDTFFIDSDIVLRTHTSNVQIHLMENQDPPLRHICCGRVFRNEAVSYKSFCLFHQVEGLVINESSSFAEMKGTLEYFAKEMFGKDTKMRFRPSYFPFTEPSAEVDIWNDKLNQWMEILGCGMVNPNVLENVGYDSEKYQGFAFGMGIERIAMIKYGIRDIRLFYQNDKRFLEQF
ncbi:MAG: phenylalanine--tRNA ligase subunit alpha [Candidatus Neomarinimicrobiota bacterium]|nr:phenylalanine--tRNA ligase subunit alpha [Candidatus Neomarinimicrobiota bacterium]